MTMEEIKKIINFVDGYYRFQNDEPLTEKGKRVTENSDTVLASPDDMKKIEGEQKSNEYLEPQNVIALINAGELEKKPINGRYKPVRKITLFMEWLNSYGYEDCLNFDFFKRHIYYKQTDGTIKQYLKPTNYGVKRPKKLKGKRKGNDSVINS